jgi:hypothetical protein
MVDRIADDDLLDRRKFVLVIHSAADDVPDRHLLAGEPSELEVLTLHLLPRATDEGLALGFFFGSGILTNDEHLGAFPKLVRDEAETVTVERAALARLRLAKHATSS